GRCIARRPSPQDHLAAPLAQRPTVGLRRRFQTRVLFLADFETDGFRAQRRLHHVPASSLAISAETSSRAIKINKFACVNFRLLYSNRTGTIFLLAALLSASSRAVTAGYRAAPF